MRQSLKKAAEIREVRDMWYAVRDILNLLTMIIVPEPDVITPETVAGPDSGPGR